jgi:hypothetical protein
MSAPAHPYERRFPGNFARGSTAFSILVFTESMQKSGFFLKKKPPSTHS